MLLAALVLTLLNPAPPAPQPASESLKAECLKTCAGAPKHANGQKLLACLQRCEPPAPAVAPDAGAP